MSVEEFIKKYGNVSESYFFYNNQIELRFDPKEHKYLLVNNGELIPQDGVTQTVHIIDKSDVLMRWAVRMMSNKLLSTVPIDHFTVDGAVVRQIPLADFEKLVHEAKTAHKEKLEEAGNVGTMAHDWIERYIKSILAGDEPLTHTLLSQFPFDERAKNCCVAALDWMQRHNVRWISTERKIYSRKYQYAGTMDGLCRVDSCDNPQCCRKAFKDRLSVADWKSSNYLYIEYLLQTAAYMQAYMEETHQEVLDRWVIRLGKDDGEFDPWHLTVEDFSLDFKAFLDALHLTRSMESLRTRMKDRQNVLNTERKAQKKIEREAALKIKCKSADKYQGKRKPKCNGGEPCESCSTKYEQVQAAKPAKKPVKKRVKKPKEEENPVETDNLS